MSIFTIGYAGKSIEKFLSDLRENNVTALVDVRSLPYSRMFPEYNRGTFKQTLASNGISYIYLGNELGPRSENPSHYDKNGQVQFSVLQKTEAFQSGIMRLKSGIEKGFSIAMMCAEKNPLTCHRALLISEYLEDNESINVFHINFDGVAQRHTDLMKLAAKEMGYVSDLFTSEESAIELAYSEMCKKYAYRKPEYN